jgi:hypothetical protein
MSGEKVRSDPAQNGSDEGDGTGKIGKISLFSAIIKAPKS